jgi:hypothetical protein
MIATTEKGPELTEGPGFETRGTVNLTTVETAAFAATRDDGRLQE